MTGRRGRFSQVTTRGAILATLGLQVAVAVLLLGGDVVSRLPDLARDPAPSFDQPVRPGDQTRRYAPRRMPLSPEDQREPFETTGDMPARLSFETEGDRLWLTGSIDDGDAARFRTTLDSLPDAVTWVGLNSPGGLVAEALEIGVLLREAGLNTVVEARDICLSACPYIFAAGVERQAGAGARIGVHQHYFDVNTALPAFLAVEQIQRGQGRVLAHFVEMGVDPRVMVHSLATPPEEIYVLLPEQLTEYALVTAEE